LDKNSRVWSLRIASDVDAKEDYHTDFTQSLAWPERDGEEMVKVEWEFKPVSS
jgi:hypothetical protein